MPTGVFELAGLPQAFLDLAYLLLILEEEMRGLAVTHNLGGERQVANMLEGGLECHDTTDRGWTRLESIVG